MSYHKTFIELVEEKCWEYPKKTAIHEGTRRVSFGELWDLSGRVYGVLLSERIGKEDVVMISMDSVSDEIITMIGVLRAGAAFVIAQKQYHEITTRYMYADCGCKMLIDSMKLAKMFYDNFNSKYENMPENIKSAGPKGE